jgi:hypothetical protein
MLRRLRPNIATIVSVIFFVIFCFVFPFRTFAEGEETLTDFDSYTTDNPLNKDLQEFCLKRQGNQMNLETWYSGKCTPGGDTFSGDNVGFADIVILDLAEKLSGTNDPTQTFSKTIKTIFTNFKDQSYNSDADKKIALDNARQQLFASQNTGLIGESGKFITMLFQYQPASTQSYLAHVSDNLQQHKIIHSALAASNGVGFTTFAPFLTIWMATRNLAYFILVIFFVAYGFMMMFRVNLGQKTVITVQLAIPKLIITLLIITFSYAIVGLIYDLMWVVLYFILGYLKNQGILIDQGWQPYSVAAGTSKLGLIGSFVINMIAAIPASFIGVSNLIFGKIGVIVGTASLAVISIMTGGGFNVIIIIILLFAVLISYAKLFMKLIGAFISVLLSLITGPIVLLGNALPGSSAIGTWLRSIFANLMVFPTTAIFLLFSYLLMAQPLVGTCNDILNAVGGTKTISDFFGVNNGCESLFGIKDLVPTSGAITGIPLITPLGGFDARAMLALLGIALLLMAAKYVDMVKDVLKVPPFKYGTAISEALKFGVSQNERVASGGYKGVPGGGKASQLYGPSASGEKNTFNRVEEKQGGTNIEKTVSGIK